MFPMIQGLEKLMVDSDDGVTLSYKKIRLKDTFLRK